MRKKIVTKIIWHNYEFVKPPKADDYLVCFSDTYRLPKTDMRFGINLRIATWYNGEWSDHYDDEIGWWAELPLPPIDRKLEWE